MFRKLLSSFQKTTAPRLEDIPKYPQMEQGIPAVAVDDLLRSQQELIDKISDTTRYSKEHFEQWYLPAIKRYAGLVHLLPASESHHHSGVGGLFRHGLEVGHYALDIITNYGGTIAMDKVGEQRRNIIPRWELACFLAGLTHDIGKVATDFDIHDKTGRHLWNPFTSDLLDWMKEHKTDRYHLRFSNDRARHKEHEQTGGLLFDRVILDSERGYLGDKCEREIISKMLSTINGTASGRNIIYEYVQRADQKSVEKDLKANNGSNGSISMTVGTPVERHIVDAMRRLLRSGEWHVNKPGSRVWVIDKELYIVWLKGADDITDLLAQDKVPGIPRDPDSLADILIERNIATNCMVEGHGRRYWWIVPDVLQQPKKGVSLRVLKITNSESLIDPLPSSTVGRVMDRSPREEKNGINQPGPEGDVSKQDETPAPTETVVAAPTPAPVAVTPPSPVPAENPVESTVKLPEIPTQTDVFSAPSADAELILPNTTKEAGEPQTVPPNHRKQQPSTRVINNRSVAIVSSVDQRIEAPRPTTQQQEMKRSLQGEDEEQYDWASQHLSLNYAGGLIHAVAEDIALGRTQWGDRAIRFGTDQVALRYPECFSEQGADPSEIMKQMEAAGWLELDPVNFIKKVRQVDGFTKKVDSPTNALVLEKEASEAFLVVAGTPAILTLITGQQHTPAPPPSSNNKKRKKLTAPPPDRSDVPLPSEEPPTRTLLAAKDQPKPRPVAPPKENKVIQEKNEKPQPEAAPTKGTTRPVQEEPSTTAIEAFARMMTGNNPPFEVVMIRNVPHTKRDKAFEWLMNNYGMSLGQMNDLTEGDESPLIAVEEPGHKFMMIRLRAGQGDRR